ncbi:Flp family type IVb pilin [Rhodovastum sp. RN2-1]|uniref:Flp family type IVb pilin n=1 Tax=Limobrevibacterium gyesilva TaxID=2991712 RepID=A0AA41YTB8_9PROT|nr:Flp family type IVb pilin [Limobrevibacterium gyesilva]
MARLWCRLLGVKQEHRGVTAIEYALIAMVLGAAVLAGAQVLGNALAVSFAGVSRLFPT